MKTLKIKPFVLPITFGLTVILMLLSSCKHDGISADQMEQIDFTQQVLPIFQTSCATSGCHDSRGESGYVFTDYAHIMEAITPGNADKSEAYKSITSTFQLMPPNNPLTTSQRTLIRLWIDQGAKQ